ncbi:MAG: histidine--tRNA ligase [Muribaculaceae bacterium]|nr:histidine--tRNA ligase [Muribaculaceae bacterium]
MSAKPSIPKGTRDFGPVESARRQYIFSTISDVFGLFGFSRIETPALENLSTLLGKYGEEGDRLIFKVLNSGDFMRSVAPEELAEADSRRIATRISEKGLRYDLTVPFARFVVQHRQELQMPFKRYQIQPVWRADRPQRGRYREFYQCDADIVGSASLLSEVELLQMIDEVFRRLGIRIAIHLNNRKVLAGIATLINAPEHLTDITVAIDKIDKIGIDKVAEELLERGLTDAQIEALRPILMLEGSIDERLDSLAGLLAATEEGAEGVSELRFVATSARALGLDAELRIDPSLARGLDYYTGTIIEVKATDVAMGSISGGGRYDNLTGVFGMPGIPGVGISFGADRIYDVLTTLDLFPADTTSGLKVMFANFGTDEAIASMKIMKRMRSEGISAEIYPDAAKMKKQMSRADAMAIPFVAMVGADEMNAGTVTLKNMITGDQNTVSVPEAIAIIKEATL